MYICLCAQESNWEEQNGEKARQQVKFVYKIRYYKNTFMTFKNNLIFHNFSLKTF